MLLFTVKDSTQQRTWVLISDPYNILHLSREGCSSCKVRFNPSDPSSPLVENGPLNYRWFLICVATMKKMAPLLLSDF